MSDDRGLIRTWNDPGAGEVGGTVGEFLERLAGPTWLHFPGHDRSRTRAVSTLLHGNEPSGIRAIHDWIRNGERPVVDLVCFIGSVGAALAPPGFAQRFLPGSRDLNRCFCEPFAGREGTIAAELLRMLRKARPEALLDLHNTSGSGPAYAVSARHTPEHEALTRLFSRHFILTDLRLGTLMEATADDIPTVTIECGGAGDPRSDEVARDGFFRFATAESVLADAGGQEDLTILRHPIRVELREGAQVTYASMPASGCDLTFLPDVDRYNFGIVGAGHMLGWLGSRGLEAIAARDAEGKDRAPELFNARNGCLEVARPTRFFMVTTNPQIARSDCLFYAIPCEAPPALPEMPAEGHPE